jgi:hypothetical protein
MNRAVEVSKDPKGPAGPDLKYQTSQHSDNQSNPHDDLTRSDYRDARITMAFSMYNDAVSFISKDLLLPIVCSPCSQGRQVLS